MEVIAKNSKVCSTLHGVFTPFRDGIMFTFRINHYDGSRYQFNLKFRDISALTYYLFDVCRFSGIELYELLVYFRN